VGIPEPLLWHISISHYSEKARWALDFKRVPHRRRAIPGGFHMPVALALTRGEIYTFPVLVLDGEVIGDSSAIIGALERRCPEPPLYPEDPAERRRALDLEEWFDEELGPPLRLLAWHELVKDPERLARMMDHFLPPQARGTDAARSAAARFASVFTDLRYGVKSDEGAERARERVLAGLDHLEAELDGNEYLAGDRFSVADLTAAALFYPLVLPPEGPDIGDAPDALERFRAPLADRTGFRWVQETYRRHRTPARADTPVPA